MNHMRRSHSLPGIVIVLILGINILTGCAQHLAGTPTRVGIATTTTHANPQHQYPNLLKECEVLSTDVIAGVVGADKRDIQSTFVGAICRWQALGSAGLVDITRFWYENGSLDNERAVAKFLGYQLEERMITGIPSLLMRTQDGSGACGIASDAAGVVGWWINPQTPSNDTCQQVTKLMELTLATNA